MASAAFERFRFSFFEDAYSARDGLDLEAVGALEGEERSRAEQMLLDYLPDARGVIGLGALRSLRAEVALVRMLEAEPHRDSPTKTYLAKALWQIRPDRRRLDALLDILASARDGMQRMSAAVALHDVRDPTMVRALTTALDDSEGLVRHHAARGLLALHGVPDTSEDPQHMIYRVMSEEAGRRQLGKRDILVAIAGRPIRQDSA